MARRSLLSMLLAMRPSAVASASLSLSSAVAVARSTRLRAAALHVPLAVLAANVCMPSLTLAVDVAHIAFMCAAALCGVPLAALASVIGYAVVRCRVGLVVALISCRCRSPRSVRAAALRGVRLSTFAAIVVVLSLSSAVAFAHIARVRTAAQCSAPLAAFTAAVSYAVLGCRVGLAVALINCHRSHLALEHAAALRGVPFATLTAVVGYAVTGCRVSLSLPLLSSAVVAARIARVPPLCIACRSLLSLLSSAMPSSVVALA